MGSCKDLLPTRFRIFPCLLFLSTFSIAPVLIFLGVTKTNCTEYDKHFSSFDVKNMRNCLFKKSWPPEPFAFWRITDWMPTKPLSSGSSGRSSTFNPSTSCMSLKPKQSYHIKQQLKHWTVASLTPELMETYYHESGFWGGGRFRVQIIDGRVYAVPPDCCPGAPRWSKCCAPRLGPREKYTLAQLWTLANWFGKDLPNVDFFLNTRDEPSGLEVAAEEVPIFAYAVYKRGQAVSVPYMSDGKSGGAEVGTGLNSIATPWEERLSRAVWRGGPTGFNWDWSIVERGESRGHPRGILCLFAGKHPDLLDLGFASGSMWEWPDNPVPCRVSKKGAPMEHAMSYKEQQSKYKYIIDVEGFSWSSRLKNIINLDMLVIKLEDEYSDFTMNFLNENEHYILAKRNSSDLDVKIKWAQEHDTIAHQIAISSSIFSSKYLSEEAELCYWYTLLLEYSKLQKTTTAHKMQPHKNARLVNHKVTSMEYTELTTVEFLFLFLAFILTVVGYISMICCIYNLHPLSISPLNTCCGSLCCAKKMQSGQTPGFSCCSKLWGGSSTKVDNKVQHKYVGDEDRDLNV